MNELERKLLLLIADTVMDRQFSEYTTVTSTLSACGAELPKELVELTQLKFDKLVDTGATIRAIEGGMDEVSEELLEEVRCQLMVCAADARNTVEKVIGNAEEKEPVGQEGR